MRREIPLVYLSIKHRDKFSVAQDKKQWEASSLGLFKVNIIRPLEPQKLTNKHVKSCLSHTDKTQRVKLTHYGSMGVMCLFACDSFSSSYFSQVF